MITQNLDASLYAFVSEDPNLALYFSSDYFEDVSQIEIVLFSDMLSSQARHCWSEIEVCKKIK